MRAQRRGLALMLLFIGQAPLALRGNFILLGDAALVFNLSQAGRPFISIITGAGVYYTLGQVFAFIAPFRRVCVGTGHSTIGRFIIIHFIPFNHGQLVSAISCSIRS